MSLLVSRIGGIKVIQAEDSKLDVTHKSEDGGKAGGYGKDGSNLTIDLGKGKRINTIKVRVSGDAENKALHDILYLDRYTTVTDKFRGTMDVYIDKFSVTDSDKHVGLSIYEITFTEQDLAKASSPSLGINLSNTAKAMSSEIFEDISNMNFNDVSSLLDEFNSPLVNQFKDGLISIVNSFKDINDQRFFAVESARLKNDIFNSIKNMTISPNYLSDTINKIIDFRTPQTNLELDNYYKQLKASGLTGNIRGSTAKSNTVTEHLNSPNNYPIAEVLPIFRPKADGVEVDFEYPGIDDTNLDITYVLNKIKVSRSINSIIRGGFHSKSDFEKEVNDTITRLSYIGKRFDEVDDVIYLLQSYASNQRYREIIEYNVLDDSPLAKIVFELYGSLADYDNIRDMNGLADNDRIKGKIMVYSRNIS